MLIGSTQLQGCTWEGCLQIEMGQRVGKALRKVTRTDEDGLGLLVWEKTKGGCNSYLQIFEGLLLGRGI